jgi:hypothetical protein
MKKLATLISTLALSGCVTYQHIPANQVFPGQADAKQGVTFYDNGCKLESFFDEKYLRLEKTCRINVNNKPTSLREFTITEFIDTNSDGKMNSKCIRNGRGSQPLLEREVRTSDRRCRVYNSSP